MFAAPGYQGPPSSHFDGERFFNQPRVKSKTFSDFMRWRRNRDPGPWRGYARVEPGPKPPHAIGDGTLRVSFVNHSTTLLQIDGVNILTDPIFSRRASPVSFAGPKRAHSPGIRFADLPPIHAVLISHNHYDHLDVPTLRRLSRAHDPVVLAGLGNRRLLAKEGIERAVDLDWWGRVELRPGVQVTFVPAQHWSGRGLGDRNKTLWGGFVVEGKGHRIYFAGDTGFGPHFERVRQRFGPPSLALLPIGAYKPRWFMKDMHISPAEAVKAFQVLKAQRAVAIHHGTFPLGDDGQDEPVEDLRQAMQRAGLSAERFWVLAPGEARDVPGLPARPAVSVSGATERDEPAAHERDEPVAKSSRAASSSGPVPAGTPSARASRTASGSQAIFEAESEGTGKSR
jgi:L-ascorbate metabolism protein UlaG (beta-lactamase superfamily)